MDARRARSFAPIMHQLTTQLLPSNAEIAYLPAAFLKQVKTGRCFSGGVLHSAGARNRGSYARRHVRCRLAGW